MYEINFDESVWSKSVPTEECFVLIKNERCYFLFDRSKQPEIDDDYIDWRVFENV